MVKKIKDEWAPLSAGFMLTSILGFIISIWLIMDFSTTWGFTFTFFFIIMFFASMISMTKAEPIPEHMDQLAIHEHEKAYKPHLKQKQSPKQRKKFYWYEPIFLLYLVIWAYFIFHYFNSTLDYTPINLAIAFLAFTVFFGVLFLVDVFSHEILPTWEQAVFAILIIVSVGYAIYFVPIAAVGSLIYYLHMKLLQKE